MKTITLPDYHGPGMDTYKVEAYAIKYTGLCKTGGGWNYIRTALGTLIVRTRGINALDRLTRQHFPKATHSDVLFWNERANKFEVACSGSL